MQEAPSPSTSRMERIYPSQGFPTAPSPHGVRDNKSEIPLGHHDDLISVGTDSMEKDRMLSALSFLPRLCLVSFHSNFPLTWPFWPLLISRHQRNILLLFLC